MRKYIIILVILMASIVGFAQDNYAHEKDTQHVSDTTFVVYNMMGQIVYMGKCDAKMSDKDKADWFVSNYGKDIYAGVYFINEYENKEKAFINKK